MTVFNNIQTKNIDEITDWFDKHFQFDNAPWWKYWDENYCRKCNPIKPIEDLEYKEYSYCELNGNCVFFKDVDEIPNNKQIIKMWLERECD